MNESCSDIVCYWENPQIRHIIIISMAFAYCSIAVLGVFSICLTIFVHKCFPTVCSFCCSLCSCCCSNCENIKEEYDPQGLELFEPTPELANAARIGVYEEVERKDE